MPKSKSGCGCLVLIILMGLFIYSCNRAADQVRVAEEKRVASLTPEEIEAEKKQAAKDEAARIRNAEERRQKREADEKQEEDAKAPKLYSEGDGVFVGYTAYTVWRSWWQDNLSDNQFLDQSPNATYLFVELTVRNDDKKARVVPPFKLIDENGAEYEASSRAWAVEGSIGVIESLNPSVSKQGFVVFDVPQNHKYRLKLSGGFWSLEDAFVQISPKSSRQAVRAAEEKKADEAARIERERRAEDLRRAAEERAAFERERREAIEAAKWRTWIDATGKHKVEAKFNGMAFGKVKLLKRDDTTIQMSLEQLSAEDQAWIKGKKWEQDVPPSIR